MIIDYSDYFSNSLINHLVQNMSEKINNGHKDFKTPELMYSNCFLCSTNSLAPIGIQGSQEIKKSMNRIMVAALVSYV